MERKVTKTQIDRLGERLKEDIDEADLQMLDRYRRSFAGAHEIVVGTIKERLALEPAGRSAESTTSIIEKLRRESIRLTQMQDIAGCRVVVPDTAKQEEVVQSLDSLFKKVTIVDRRKHPSHGYRAVHVIVRESDKMIEVQVRTDLQHLWAELSERLSDIVGPTIKYGEGDEYVKNFLITCSTKIAEAESVEARLAEMEMQKELPSLSGFAKAEKQYRITQIQKELFPLKEKLIKVLRKSIGVVENIGTDK